MNRLRPALKTAKTKSAFRDWFKEQYGEAPNIPKLHALRRQHFEITDKASAIRNSLSHQERLADLYNTALYAWNAGRDRK